MRFSSFSTHESILFDGESLSATGQLPKISFKDFRKSAALRSQWRTGLPGASISPSKFYRLDEMEVPPDASYLKL